MKILSVSYAAPASVASERSNNTAVYNAPWGLYTIIIIDKEGTERTIVGEALLNATGRAPNVYGIGLEKVCMQFISLILLITTTSRSVDSNYAYVVYCIDDI